MNKTVLKKTDAQMLADLCGDETLSSAIEKDVRETQLITILMDARARKGLRQKDIAERMGVSVSTVSRMEDSCDADLRFGDILKYMKAIGLKMSMLMDDATDTTTLRIKNCVFMIEDLLRHLTSLARTCDDDPSIVEGISRFRGEVLYNFLMKYKATGEGFPVFKTEDNSGPDAPGEPRTPDQYMSCQEMAR